MATDISGFQAGGESLSLAGIGAFLADRTGEILWVNAVLADPGANPRALRDLFRGAWTTAGAGGGPLWPEPGAEMEVELARDDSDRHALVTAPWAGEGALLGLVVRKAPGLSERAAQRERDLYLARAVEDSADAFISIDNEGRIRQWNDGARQMFGYRAEEVRGKSYKDLLVPPDVMRSGDLQRIDEKMAGDGFVRGYETKRLAKDGRLLPVDVTISRLFDEEGLPAGRSIIYRNISERLRLEAVLRKTVEELQAANQDIRRNQERLIALEKLSAIGEMSARVAHEIRTPLVTIGGFANTLLRGAAEGSPARRYLEIISEEVRRLEAIVAEILDYVRPPRHETDECDLNAILRDAVRPFEQEMADRGVEAAWSLAEAVPPVRANRYQLAQVFTNLVQNALQAMKSGGTLKLGTAAGVNHVSVTVADTGEGIPEPHRREIFRPFFTTKASGSGLGLAIAAKIIAQCHGTISFESAEGRGTTFEVRLPLSREQPK